MEQASELRLKRAKCCQGPPQNRQNRVDDVGDSIANQTPGDAPHNRALNTAKHRRCDRNPAVILPSTPSRDSSSGAKSPKPAQSLFGLWVSGPAYYWLDISPPPIRCYILLSYYAIHSTNPHTHYNYTYTIQNHQKHSLLHQVTTVTTTFCSNCACQTLR